jgi:hypothetical protein
MKRLLYLALALALASCGKDAIEETSSTPLVDFTVSQNDVFFGAGGGSASLVITSQSDWTTSSYGSWFSISPQSGSAGTTTVTITAGENSGGDLSGSVTFTCAEGSIRLPVNQEAAAPVSGSANIKLESADTESSEDNVANTTFFRKISIVWSASGATVSGDENGIVSVSGGCVTADNRKTTEKIVYELSGSSSNGYFKVYSNNKQAFVLNSLSLTNPNGAAINNQGKKRCFVLVNGMNFLADGGSYTLTPSDEDEKAAFFSEGQLIFSGSGSLTVKATGKAGITSDDYVRLMSSPSVKVSSSAGHGVRGKDAVIVSNGLLDIAVSAAGKKGVSSDSLARFNGGATTITVSGNVLNESGSYTSSAGIKADQIFIMEDGSLSVTSTGQGGKGIKCGDADEKVVGFMYFKGGTVDVKVSGTNNTSADKGAKAVKCDGPIFVQGGDISVYCARHEAVESKHSISITSGSMYVISDGDDAINCSKNTSVTGSTGVLTVSGGYTFAWSTGISPRSSGKPGDAFDSNGNMILEGGVAYGVSSKQPDLAFDANTEGGATLYIKNGATVIGIGGVENGTSSNWSQSVYSGSWSTGKSYALYNTSGGLICAFKAPTSGASGLYVSGPSLSNTACLGSVTVSGGTSYAGGMIITGCTVSGGSTLSLSAYSGGGGGPGGGGWPGGGRPGH